jgi:hypothetical protein
MALEETHRLWSWTSALARLSIGVQLQAPGGGCEGGKPKRCPSRGDCLPDGWHQGKRWASSFPGKDFESRDCFQVTVVAPQLLILGDTAS